MLTLLLVFLSGVAAGGAAGVLLMALVTINGRDDRDPRRTL